MVASGHGPKVVALVGLRRLLKSSCTPVAPISNSRWLTTSIDGAIPPPAEVRATPYRFLEDPYWRQDTKSRHIFHQRDADYVAASMAPGPP